MPLNVIVTTIVALRAAAWLFFEAIQLRFEEEREAIGRTVLEECLRDEIPVQTGKGLWISESQQNALSAKDIVEKVLISLRTKRMTFAPDHHLTRQIWVVRGAVNASFASTFVFLAYGLAFPLVCSLGSMCIETPFRMTLNEALIDTSLIVAIVTFMYALSFTARCQLGEAIMNITLWDLWKRRVTELRTTSSSG